MSDHVPLAWRNLTHDKRRFVVSTAGIALAVLLVFVELGFWNALLDASVALVRQFNGELVIVSKARYTMAIREPFSIRRLAQARAVAGVAEVVPIYIEDRLSLWRSPGPHDPNEPSSRPIRVIAFNPLHHALRNPEIEAQLPLLRLERNVLIDRRSKEEYGEREANLTRELAGQTIHVVGTFALGTDFTTDGNVVTSDRTFAKLFPNRGSPQTTLNLADVGIVQLKPDSDVQKVRQDLEGAFALPDDVHVFTLPEFVDKEWSFWQRATPVGFIFTLGLVMGVIVGMVICSQILSADVADHLKEYATLKAIGYSNGYLVRVVLQEALLLCLLAFGPALALSFILYGYLGALTGLPLFLTFWRIVFVLLLAAGMCVVSGLLALRKVIEADPAEVFG
jgi:putative ABC transport system permease protein